MRLPNIYLIGPMGSGKTTIGRCLAKELGLEFYDTDQIVEQRTGVPIAWIFDLEGETGFRQRECKIIEEFTDMQGIILATGGGAVLLPENRAHLSARGYVVYLRVSVEQQLFRLHKSTNRPLLKTADPKTTLESLLKMRQPLYEEIADVIFETDNMSIPAIVSEILNYLNRLKEIK